MLVVTIISFDDDTTATYPDFLVDLFDIYEAQANGPLAYWRVPVHLNRQEYETAAEHVEALRVQRHSKKSNEAFRQFVRLYCQRMAAKETEVE